MIYQILYISGWTKIQREIIAKNQSEALAKFIASLPGQLHEYAVIIKPCKDKPFEAGLTEKNFDYQLDN